MWVYLAYAAIPVSSAFFFCLPKLVALLRSPRDKIPETSRAVFGRPEPPRIEPPGYVLRLPPAVPTDHPDDRRPGAA